MPVAESLEKVTDAPFGTVFADKMAICWFRDGEWSPFEIQPIQPLQLHPYAHVLHYASSCFEGLKIHRWEDGSIHAFRLSSHIRRFQTSAELLCLPVPNAKEVEQMVLELAAECRDWVPQHPGSLYVRPTLIGTLPSIGAAAGRSHEACLFVIMSPVGAYFRGGLKPLRILIEDQHMRTSPDFGRAKAGANYASALSHILKARREYGVDQVLFAPNNDVQETGAANFFLIRDEALMTKHLDPTFLHGVTRDSLIKLAPELGYQVSERSFTTEELLAWIQNGEAALSGTAAILAGIGTFIYKGREYRAGNGEFGPNTLKLRSALLDIQKGIAPDSFNWLTRI